MSIKIVIYPFLSVFISNLDDHVAHILRLYHIILTKIGSIRRSNFMKEKEIDLNWPHLCFNFEIGPTTCTCILFQENP